ncbi:MAG: hypothetical protein IT290_10665, partial [Deltaproteobacteria bacterium]|nr:hypothetical protein [Deltaproteobacteria bacterium]
MKRICAASGEEFEISEEDLAFYDRVGPTIGTRHFPIPPPTLSPNERLRRRLAFRSEREFHRNTCSLTGKPLLSVYSPDKSVRVCDKSLWLDVDNRELGRDVDFTRPFFDQFRELFAETLKPNIIHAPPMVNSEYTHFCGNLKNSFMCFDSGQAEDLAYSVFTGYSRDSVDSYYLYRGELCYEVVKGEDCYAVLHSTRCQNCNFSAFLYDCIGCSHCIGCVNLRHKEYYVFNKPVDRVTFERVWKELCSGSFRTWSRFREEFDSHRLQYPHRAVRNIQAEGCIGDDLTNCEEVYDSFNCYETRKLRFCHDIYLNVEDTYDFASWGEGAYRCYEMTGSGGLEGKVGMSGCLFSSYIFYGGYNVLYSLSCLEKCQNLFGCADLRRQEYCVLN